MFPYLAWLDPFYKSRKTISNFITLDSENEESEVPITFSLFGSVADVFFVV